LRACIIEGVPISSFLFFTMMGALSAGEGAGAGAITGAEVVTV